MPRFLKNEADRLSIRFTFNLTKRERAYLDSLAIATNLTAGEVLRSLLSNRRAQQAQAKRSPVETDTREGGKIVQEIAVQAPSAIDKFNGGR